MLSDGVKVRSVDSGLRSWAFVCSSEHQQYLRGLTAWPMGMGPFAHEMARRMRGREGRKKKRKSSNFSMLTFYRPWLGSLPARTPRNPRVWILTIPDLSKESSNHHPTGCSRDTLLKSL